MIGNSTEMIGERLTLGSRISELAQVSPWVDALALRYAIPDKTRFAMKLCLEEVLSNVIRHGYCGEPNHSVAVQMAYPRKGYFVLVVEDETPPFNPMDAPELPPYSLEESQVGGQGIRLLQRFADTLEYRPTPTGNRLSIGFFAAGSAVTRD